MSRVQLITPNLWFDTQAEEAAQFYVSIFANSRIKTTTYYAKEKHSIDGITEGMVMTVVFELDGQEFIALNGGSKYSFNEAISFVVNCATQQDIDYYWANLSQGGDEKSQVCGWLKDKYGVSWQIVPNNISQLVSQSDPERAARVMRALLQMKKIDLSLLNQAYSG